VTAAPVVVTKHALAEQQRTETQDV